MSAIYRRDRTADLGVTKRSRALAYGVDQLKRAANALQAARCGDDKSLRNAVLTDACRRLHSMQREIKALE